MSKGSVLILVGPEYEDLEVWYPKYRLEAAGYDVPLVGIGESSYRGKHG
jgi:protease I